MTTADILLKKLAKADDDFQKAHPDPLSHEEYIKQSPEHAQWAKVFNEIREYVKTIADDE